MKRSPLRPSKDIFEAIVRSVNYVNNTCELEPLNVEQSSVISDVPLPNMYTNNNSGLFLGITPNTRVIASTTAATGSEFIVILGFLPNQYLIKNNYDKTSANENDFDMSVLSYPELKEGDVVLRGSGGESLVFGDKNSVSLQMIGGEGLFLNKHNYRLSSYAVSHNLVQYTNSGRQFTGAVHRIKRDAREKNPIPDPYESNLFADIDFHAYSYVAGLFSSSNESKITASKLKLSRNVGLAESRSVVNEFLTDSMFTGFEDEVLRAEDKLPISKFSSGPISREPLSLLKLSEHELLEFVSGNLVDIDGAILDLNYQQILMSRDNVVPKKDIAASYDAARRLSRRGVGFHFQLATLDQLKKSSDTSKNFTFDIDKEGVLKLHVPSSTNTGNIPFPSSTVLDKNGGRKTSFINKSKEEPIPVLLRDDSGKPALPYRYPNSGNRYTGVRYENSGSTESGGYFPSGESGSEQTSFVRVNPTVHHNMYAAAERLIANTIDKIIVPNTFVDDSGSPLELGIGKAFERYAPTGGDYNSSTNNFNDINVPQYMSSVVVNPRPPAIYPGGGNDVSVAGNFYTNDEHPPYSNEFVSVPNPDGSGFSAVYDETGTLKRQPSGGKSANMIFDGSVELSVGKDNYDGKSFLLDTAGSAIAWFGKDKNNRSLILQSDGDVLLNVGGSYTGSGQNQKMNVGRLDIRVNVTDKRFTVSDDNVGAESDYIISISENGLVIAGMKKDKPMIFRNDGKILIESISSDILLKGVDIKTVASDGKVETLRAAKR